MRIRISKLPVFAAALAAALAMGLAMAAAPAEAQSSKGKKRVAAKPAAVAKVQPHRAAFSRQQGGFRIDRSGAIYHGPDYVGQDPDPHIRFELMRELSAHYGGVD